MAKLGEILKKFQCPVCKDYVLPPIPQCQNGHVICPLCQSERSLCPLCSGPFSKQRNQTLEAIANDVPFPCKFAKYGCEELNYVSRKATHEANCKYQPFKCPYCDAEVASYSNALLQHLSKVHENKPIFQNCVEIAIKMEDLKDIQSKKSLHIHCVLEKFQEVFIFSINYSPEVKEWHFVLQMFAPIQKAEQFKGILEMKLKDKRVLYEGMVRSWPESLEDIAGSQNCLILTEQYFWGGFYGGVLRVDVKPNNFADGRVKAKNQGDI